MTDDAGSAPVPGTLLWSRVRTELLGLIVSVKDVTERTEPWLRKCYTITLLRDWPHPPCCSWTIDAKFFHENYRCT